MDGSWEFILKSYVEKTIRVFEDEEIKTILWGSCFWLENGSINTNILDIAHAAINNLLDYNELFGYYKIVIHSKVSGDYFFWGDNSGTQGFFVDEQNCVFSNSFLTIKERAASVQPNYYAIAQLFSAGYILTYAAYGSVKDLGRFGYVVGRYGLKLYHLLASLSSRDLRPLWALEKILVFDRAQKSLESVIECVFH